jgi:hypothetical protein
VAADGKCPCRGVRQGISSIYRNGFCAHNANLERFRAKWIPVGAKKTRRKPEENANKTGQTGYGGGNCPYATILRAREYRAATVRRHFPTTGVGAARP